MAGVNSEPRACSKRPEQCADNSVVVRRLDAIACVAPPEIAHRRQYLIELMHILDSGPWPGELLRVSAKAGAR